MHVLCRSPFLRDVNSRGVKNTVHRYRDVNCIEESSWNFFDTLKAKMCGKENMKFYKYIIYNTKFNFQIYVSVAY